MGINDYRRRKRESRGDLFSTLDNYDPTEIYLGAVDDKGHSRQVRVAFPPEIVGMLEAIVGSRNWPYASSAQIIRDAVIHHCKWMADEMMSPELMATIANVIARERLDNIDRFARSSADIVDRARQFGDNAMKSEDWRQLRQVIDSVSDSIDGMHEPYAGQLEAMVKQFVNALPEQWKAEYQ